MEVLQPRYISVVEPVGAALKKTKQILFSPFDLGKWFTIGFCAFLATLGEGGGPNGGGGGNTRGGSSQEFHQAFESVKETVVEYWPIILTVGMIVAILIIAVSLVFTWLNSRGKFMFLHCVARNVGEVVHPWKQYAHQGNSLFLFKVVFGFLAMVSIMILVAGLAFSVFIATQTPVPVLPITSAVLLGISVFVLAIAVGLVLTLTKDFVVPIMYLHQCTLTEGWRCFWALCRQRKGIFVLYILFLIPINIAIGIGVLFVILLTCCCAGIVLMIPYIGTVIMLPVLVWRRAYSALFLAQFGPEYDVFAQAPQPVVVPSDLVPPVGPITPSETEQNF